MTTPLIEELVEKHGNKGVARYAVRQALHEFAARSTQGMVLVPVEVFAFYQFADAVFVAFTSQQEELKLSLDIARKAMLAAQSGK